LRKPNMNITNKMITSCYYYEQSIIWLSYMTIIFGWALDDINNWRYFLIELDIWWKHEKLIFYWYEIITQYINKMLMHYFIFENILKKLEYKLLCIFACKWCKNFVITLWRTIVSWILSCWRSWWEQKEIIWKIM
jgi:hypothetical protein